MNKWKNTKEYPLVNHIIHDDDYAEIELIEDGYKLMAVPITMSRHSGSRAGEKFWEYCIARIDEDGDLIDINNNDIGICWDGVTNWMELPEQPYSLTGEQHGQNKP